MRHALLAVILTACATSGPDAPEPQEVDGAVTPGFVDARPPSTFVDASTSFTCDPADGPAAALLIDDSVHPGGVWNEDMDFRMANYPIGWAMATVHASLLLRARCINLS